MAVTRFKARIGKGSTQGSGVYGSASQDMAAIAKEFNRLIDHFNDQTPEVLMAAFEPAFDKSQVYVPVDKGDLKESGYLEVRRQQKGATIGMGYGRGGHPDYAPTVHEDTTILHKDPTRSKFLQAALDEDWDRIQQALVNGSRVAGGF